MNAFLILFMGRVAGVTAAETRERLLRAAVSVFAQRGYDGTRVADIAKAANVSNGALYAHFGSKAGLLVAALRAHGPRLLAEAFDTNPGSTVTDLLLKVGRRLRQRLDDPGHLVPEALAAARRDKAVGELMREYVGERATSIASLVKVAQGAGDIDPELSPDALAHFCLLLSMGSAFVTPGMHAVDEEEWAALLGRVIAAITPPGPDTGTPYPSTGPSSPHTGENQ